MDKQDLVDEVNLMVSQVRSDVFKRVAGRAFFLKDAERLLYFVNYRSVENTLNAKMFKEFKAKFDALVKRTQIYEKET